MNIYLDIDGVLLAGPGRAAHFADDFLQYILTRYPDSVYWLTTYQWRGQNRTAELLRPALGPKTRALMHRIKPTTWHDLKTDAIDFSQPFRWYDDDLFADEREVLEVYHALDNWIKVDLKRDPNQLIDEIARLKRLA